MPSIKASLSNSTELFADRAKRLLSDVQSNFKQRDAVRRKITTVAGHRFEPVVLTKPTFCSPCDKFIWGLDAQSCELCKLISHKKCLHQLVDEGCLAQQVSDETVRQLNGSRHQFRPKYFMLPTMCQHCGTLLKGLMKAQGKECARCNFSVHDNCEKYVCYECKPGRIGNNNNNDNNSGSRNNNNRSSKDETREYEHLSRVRIEDFDIIRSLGTGSFSRVYLAKLRNSPSGEEFAIKVIKKTHLVVSSDPDSVFTEKKTLNLGRKYPFLTIAHCCFQSRDRLYFVMEHVVGRNLVHHISKARKFTEDRARFYAAEIVLALMFLHSQGIVYRDLKLDNVMLDQYGHCKLLDFGMSKELSGSSLRTRTFCGTPSYISPEIIRELDYDFSVDWWSLGVLMYEMLVGYSPFEAQNLDKLYEMITNDEVHFPSTLSDRARSILEGLLSKDPQSRLGCQIMEGYALAIKEHPFFLFKMEDGSEAHQWEAIEAKRIKPPYRPCKEDLEADEYGTSGCDDVALTPIDTKDLEKISQSDFDNFSFYSGSFNSLAQLDKTVEKMLVINDLN